jgi:hypothetical protein
MEAGIVAVTGEDPAASPNAFDSSNISDHDAVQFYESPCTSMPSDLRSGYSVKLKCLWPV